MNTLVALTFVIICGSCVVSHAPCSQLITCVTESTKQIANAGDDVTKQCRLFKCHLASAAEKALTCIDMEAGACAPGSEDIIKRISDQASKQLKELGCSSATCLRKSSWTYGCFGVLAVLLFYTTR